MEQKIKWGIIGLGGIAHKFASDLAMVDSAELVAVASRSMEKAQVFGKQFGAKYCFDSYEALFRNPEVDVIYIATPHTSHKEWSIKAMEHGKNVLCEKPAGINQGEVQEMISSAKKNNVFLMEALWSRFNPAIRKTKKLIEDGEIGNIAYIHADFAFYALDRPEESRVLNPDLAGGSLLDIGLYPVFLAYLLLGKPTKILSSAKFHKTGVEIQISMIFDYANAQAILYSGFTSDAAMKAEIAGSKGAVYLPGRWHEAQSYTLQKGAETITVDLPTLGRGYSHEIEEVHACLSAGKLQSDLWSHQHSLDLTQLLDEIRAQNSITFPSEQ